MSFIRDPHNITREDVRKGDNHIKVTWRLKAGLGTVCIFNEYEFACVLRLMPLCENQGICWPNKNISSSANSYIMGIMSGYYFGSPKQTALSFEFFCCCFCSLKSGKSLNVPTEDGPANEELSFL